MMGLKISPEHLFIIVIVTLCEILPCSPKISDKRLCFDAECSVPIAEAKTLTTYNSRDKDVLSFPVNVDVTVYSKEAGDRKDLWGVEILGKRGYAPKTFIREKRVLYKPDQLSEVPTERIPTENISKDHKTESKVPPGLIDSSIDSFGIPSSIVPQVVPSFEVVEGTTINFPEVDVAEEASYATKILHSPGVVDEQPILSVHPNILSSEVPIHENFSSKTGDLPLKTEEDGTTQGKSEDKSPGDEAIDKEAEKVLDKSEEEKGKSFDNYKSLEDDIAAGLEEGQEFSEDTIEQSQDFAGIYSALQSVTSMFDSSSRAETPGAEEASADVTTPKIIPGTIAVTEKTIEEVPGVVEHEIPQAPASLERIPETPPVTPRVVEDSKVSEIAPPEAAPGIIPAITTDSEDTPKEVEYKKTSEVSSTPENIPESTPPVVTSTQGEKIPDKEPAEIPSQEPIPEDVATNYTTPSSTSPEIDDKSTVNNETTPGTVEDPQFGDKRHVIEGEGQPGIYGKDELSGPSQSIDDTVSNFNGFQNRNLLNVESGRVQKDDSKKVHKRPLSVFYPPKESLPPVSPEEKPLVTSPESPITPEPVTEEIPKNLEPTPLEVQPLATPSESPIIPEPSTEEIAETLESTTPSEAPSSPTPETPQEPLEEPEESTVLPEPPVLEESPTMATTTVGEQLSSAGVCETLGDCPSPQEEASPEPVDDDDDDELFDTAMVNAIKFGRNYWEALSYAALTAFTTLVFSLGYYYIENRRRDGQFIAKINRLEKELLVATKECSTMDETLKSTKNKLTSIEDESFGSNEMVLSLKTELDNAHQAKSELEDQVSALEKDLEAATEAGLELERMFREILATNSAENPLAKSVEDLQTRLNTQQAANESLTNALHLKTQETEKLTKELALATQKCEQLEVEVVRITGELKEEKKLRSNVQETLSKKIEDLENQLKDMSAEKINLRKQLKGKEMELKDVLEVVKQSNTHSLDFEKLADVSHVKAEAIQLAEERDELKTKLSEVEGAHQLLEEHTKVINEEVAALSEQCKIAEKEKKEAETRLEVLSNFFKEKEAERQKEEAAWLQQQGEVSTTVERLQTMHNEILSYKQQIESLKREILDQEREYKSQITSLEAKAHEQWVLARQNERRLEESKSESAQLRNRLTIIEKNLSDTESDGKLHRMESNGDPAASPLFLGGEASSSPIMFSGTSGPPPLPPSYLYGPPLPYLPPPLPPPPGLPPYDVSQRPPPLGGRLASPPPMPPLLPHSSRYDDPDSLSPPPRSPPLLPHFNPRNYPGPFGNERIPPPLPPSWGDEPLPPARNTGFHPFHRDHRLRDKGSLHSSGESLDKSHHSGKV